MIELHYWPTPNGQKIALFLEETRLDYEIHPVNIGKDEQFKHDFLKIAPNNRIPAIVDTDPADGGAPVSVFESGAILIYLALKAGKFYGDTPRERTDILQWLMWQMAGLGPMAGQNGHFNVFAPEKVPYAIQRYTAETARLYGVLDRRLEDREFVAGNGYSIADMAIYPWIFPHEAHKQDLDDFPNVKRWFEGIAARPATVRTYQVREQVQAGNVPVTAADRAALFATA